MKCTKRVTSVVAAALVAAALLTSCGGSDKKGGSVAAVKSDNHYLTNKEFKEVQLPLCEEKTTLTIWTSNDVVTMNLCGGDLNKVPFFEELEKRTNVHIEWSVPASGSETEQQNLLWASGDLPDILYYMSYTDGIDAAIDDGYLLDLTPYADAYMPNYMAAINNGNPELQKMTRTDSGRIAQVQYIMQDEQPPFYGFMVRKDWLDELGLDIPETYDDWEVMLTAFKEKKGCKAPLGVFANQIRDLGAGFGFCMDFWGTDYYIENGKVKYSLYDNKAGARKFLETMNRWYENGLIDPDFASSTQFWGDPVLVNNNQCGAFLSMYTFPSTMFAAAGAQGAEFVAVTIPVEHKGDKVTFRRPNQLNGSAYVVSQKAAKAGKAELAVKWMDYFFSEAGALFSNYGIEGDTYTMVNGKPQYTEKMTANPEGKTFDECMRYYTAAPGQPAKYADYKREVAVIPPQYVQMMEDWGSSGYSAYFPMGAQMTVEENAEYAKLYTDISTYVNEKVMGLITGAVPMSDFDAVCKKIEDSNIKRCIELQQSAYDRYVAR